MLSLWSSVAPTLSAAAVARLGPVPASRLSTVVTLSQPWAPLAFAFFLPVCGRAHSAFSWFPGAWAPAAGSGCFWSTGWLPALRAVRHCAGFWDGGKRTRATQPYPGPGQSPVGAGWGQTSARDTESPLNDARTRRVPMLWVCPEVPVLGKSLEEALKDE